MKGKDEITLIKRREREEEKRGNQKRVRAEGRRVRGNTERKRVK